MPIPEKTTSFAQTRKKILSQSGKEYWRSVEEFADNPEFEDRIKGEFPLDVENWYDSLSRRRQSVAVSRRYWRKTASPRAGPAAAAAGPDASCAA